MTVICIFGKLQQNPFLFFFMLGSQNQQLITSQKVWPSKPKAVAQEATITFECCQSHVNFVAKFIDKANKVWKTTSHFDISKRKLQCLKSLQFFFPCFASSNYSGSSAQPLLVSGGSHWKRKKFFNSFFPSRLTRLHFCVQLKPKRGCKKHGEKKVGRLTYVWDAEQQ